VRAGLNAGKACTRRSATLPAWAPSVARGDAGTAGARGERDPTGTGTARGIRRRGHGWCARGARPYRHGYRAWHPATRARPVRAGARPYQHEHCAWRHDDAGTAGARGSATLPAWAPRVAPVDAGKAGARGSATLPGCPQVRVGLVVPALREASLPIHPSWRPCAPNLFRCRSRTPGRKPLR